MQFREDWRDTQGTLDGLVSQGTVNPALAEYLDGLGGYFEGVAAVVPRYAGPPNPVPEPASLVLPAVGDLGASGAAYA